MEPDLAPLDGFSETFVPDFLLDDFESDSLASGDSATADFALVDLEPAAPDAVPRVLLLVIELRSGVPYPRRKCGYACQRAHQVGGWTITRVKLVRAASFRT